MRINIKGSSSKQKMYLKAELILRYLIGNDDKLETMIICKSPDIDFVTSDQSIYEALGSIKPSDGFKLPKLVKLFEVVDIVSYKSGTKQDRKILTDARVEELRKLVLQTEVNKSAITKKED